jgi:hypothetical protein
MKNNHRFAWPVRPVAQGENCVTGKHYRFTVLTDRLIRMEYDPAGIFENRASQTVFYRDLPVCSFEARRENGFLRIDTGALLLTYREEAPFAADTLRVQLLSEPAATWNFGDAYEDLGGTCKTLDEADGPRPVEKGLCSRWGFSVLDDSKTLLLDETGWVAVRQEGTQDVYFFGYGYDYRSCIRDFYRITGAPSMLPAYALGNWWSRYHAYTQEEYLSLMDRFAAENVPFSVGVVDMDWHIVQIPEDQQDPELPGGWTGYTWNKALFPDYRTFLTELHKKHLKTALNLHPADGVRKHEAMYEEMAKANGIDPSTGKRVPLDLLSKDHMVTYFDILHHPYEADGVDFWWMDWQQGTDYRWIHEANKPGEYKYPAERMDPLWMLNHLHILDISRNGKRPMFFSRYSGPGSHRYPVGFSGDTSITWDSLQFQPYFTATASNIGYGWWSHDIGGHMGGYKDVELLQRWVQLGVFSPINRLHSSRSWWMQKEPWANDLATAEGMKAWLRLRHQLFPYIYTMNYRCHTDLSPLVQPMYYSHPKCDAAYRVPNQFWFGSELMVAPITTPDDRITHLGKVEAWLPDGEWFDFFTGMHYSGLGGRMMTLCRPMTAMPVFAKSGAIIPMARYADNRLCNSENMDILVFPGGDNAFTLYEDAGDGHDFETGAFCRTEMGLTWGEKARFVIGPACGQLDLIPAKRNWNIHLRGFHKSVAVQVTVDGVPAAANFQFDAQTNSTVVSLQAFVTSRICLEISGDTLIHDNADYLDRCASMINAAELAYRTKEQLWSVLNQDFPNVHKKLLKLSFECTDRENRDILKALKEMLILTREEYPR